MILFSCSSKSLITYSDENKNEYLQSFLKRNASIRSFEGDADITLNYYEAGKLETSKFNAKMMWNKNDSLALEMNYGVMGLNLADVAKLFVGKNNYVFVTRDNLFLTGLSDDTYLNEIFRIDVPIKNWGPTLFMCLFDNHQKKYDSMIHEQKNDTDQSKTSFEIRTVLFLKNENETIQFRSDVPLPGSYTFISKNGHTVKITYEGLIESDNIQFPQRIVYFNEADKSEVIIAYNSIKVNNRLPKNGFEVKIPSQMEQIIYD